MALNPTMASDGRPELLADLGEEFVATIEEA